jgi:hypothetical protein
VRVISKKYFPFSKNKLRSISTKKLSMARQRPSKINVANMQIVNWKEDFGKQALQLTGPVLIA